MYISIRVVYHTKKKADHCLGCTTLTILTLQLQRKKTVIELAKKVLSHTADFPDLSLSELHIKSDLVPSPVDDRGMREKRDRSLVETLQTKVPLV